MEQKTPVTTDANLILTDINLIPVDNQLDQEMLEKADQQELHDLENFTLSVDSLREQRHFAFSLLYALDRSDYSFDLEDIQTIFEEGFDLDVPDNLLAIEMVKGAIENREQLDEQIKPYLKNWRIERLGCCTLLILRLSLWELVQPDSVPSIVINEAVELAKAFAEKDAFRFINGVLDEICKESEEEDEEDGSDENIVGIVAP